MELKLPIFNPLGDLFPVKTHFCIVQDQRVGKKIEGIEWLRQTNSSDNDWDRGTVQTISETRGQSRQ